MLRGVGGASIWVGVYPHPVTDLSTHLRVYYPLVSRLCRDCHYLELSK